MSWVCPDDVDAYLRWNGEAYEATALNRETMEQAQEVWPTVREALTALRYLSEEVRRRGETSLSLLSRP